MPQYEFEWILFILIFNYIKKILLQKIIFNSQKAPYFIQNNSFFAMFINFFTSFTNKFQQKNLWDILL